MEPNKSKIWNPFCILTMMGNVLINHAIVTLENKIIDIDKFDSLLYKYPNSDVVHFQNSIIMPGFIDCHTHYELTELHEKKDFNNLLELMIQCGEWHKDASEKEISDSCKTGQAISFNNGTVYALDWRTQALTDNDYLKSDNVTIALEVIEPRENQAYGTYESKNSLLRKYRQEGKTCIWAPHSLYMVSEKLWNIIDESPIQITTHIAESSYESEWLSTGQGTLYNHCMSRSAITDIKIKTKNFIEAIEQRECPKAGTIFVHGVFLSDYDLSGISVNNCYLCLCPSSNLRLTGRTINLSRLLRHNVRFVIGTDSISAKYDLLYEAKLLLANCDGSEDNAIAGKILKAMTIEAAKALFVDDLYGSIEIGKSASFVVIDLMKPIKPQSVYIDIIVHGTVKAVILDGDIHYAK